MSRLVLQPPPIPIQRRVLMRLLSQGAWQAEERAWGLALPRFCLVVVALAAA